MNNCNKNNQRSSDYFVLPAFDIHGAVKIKSMILSILAYSNGCNN
jgi:hypothetical protein